MRSTKLVLGLGLLAFGACSSAHDPDGSADSADAKLAARARLQAAQEDGNQSSGGGANGNPGSPTSGPTAPDECASNKWYGDGECDAWCPQGDAKDCASGSSGSGGVACALFFTAADGKCDRSDPCGPVQDQDCQKPVGDPNAPVQGPTNPAPDKKCEPSSLAEFKSDPDCGQLACPALFSPADGKCAAKNPCDYVIDEDCAKSGGSTQPPVACVLIAYEANGKCEAAPGCEASDPKDCPVACIDIAYPVNGKCDAPPGCEGNDPDCVPTACDAIAYAKNGKCEAPPGCEGNDPDCQVACIEIAFAANGKCEAAPGCEYTDPKDCPVACITILYPKNGKCEAARGCEASDPDC